MLKLYTDTSFITEQYRRKLFPLLFDICMLKNENLKAFYTIVDSPEKADIFVFPVYYQEFVKHKQAYQGFKQIISKFNKPVWVYTSGDFGYTLKADYYNFRLGGFKSKLNDKTFVLPSFINDPYKTIESTFKAVEKHELPKVGFVGHAKLGSKKYIKELSVYFKRQLKTLLKPSLNDAQPFYPSGFKRAKYLQKLLNSNLVTTDFIYRNQYRAGIKTEEDKVNTTQEFYLNMYNNPYTFCIRGMGNFSVRLYETLAMGRIPVLINTDCKLPLETSIDWNKHAFIINESEVDSIADKLTAFHSRLTPEDFKKLQDSNRNLWLNMLERTSYFKQIHNKFSN